MVFIYIQHNDNADTRYMVIKTALSSVVNGEHIFLSKNT